MSLFSPLPCPDPTPPSGECGVCPVVLEKIAAEVLSGHLVVTAEDDGTVRRASNTILGDVTRPLWLTLGAALAGDAVLVLALGDHVEPSWSWAAGAPLYLGAAGVLTQTPPTLVGGATFIIRVGSAETPTSIFYEVRNPIIL